MTLMILSPLAILTMITVVSMLLLIGAQYKLFPYKTNTNTANIYDKGGYITELQFSRCTGYEELPQDKKCPEQLRDFSGGTFGI